MVSRLSDAPAFSSARAVTGRESYGAKPSTCRPRPVSLHQSSQLPGPNHNLLALGQWQHDAIKGGLLPGDGNGGPPLQRDGGPIIRLRDRQSKAAGADRRNVRPARGAAEGSRKINSNSQIRLCWGQASRGSN